MLLHFYEDYLCTITDIFLAEVEFSDYCVMLQSLDRYLLRLFGDADRDTIPCFLIFAGSLESSNWSILAACRLFKEVVGKKIRVLC